MEVQIKKIGVARGTVGWLAKGLETGKLHLEEGHCAGGHHNHGLWLKGEIEDQLLAVFNEFDLSAQDGEEYLRYCPVEERWNNWNHIGVTDACWKTLMNIAHQWCDECNAILDNEEPAEIQIVRIKKETTQ